MEFKKLFDKFSTGGKLLLPVSAASFDDIPWSVHPTFDGVELKNIITSDQTGGQFSFHLVKIAPGKKIGSHIHKKMSTVRTANYTRADRTAIGHELKVRYIATITI